MAKARWKGVVIAESDDGTVNPDADWYYPTPKEAARSIAGRVAFWKGVEVQR